MKYGIRTPSPSKSVKARTTGKLNRSAKKAVNPLYGKKGTGWVNDPGRAAYNKVYNKTTASLDDLPTDSSHSESNNSQMSNFSTVLMTVCFCATIGGAATLVISIINGSFVAGFIGFLVTVIGYSIMKALS